MKIFYVTGIRNFSLIVVMVIVYKRLEGLQYDSGYLTCSKKLKSSTLCACIAGCRSVMVVFRRV